RRARKLCLETVRLSLSHSRHCGLHGLSFGRGNLSHYWFSTFIQFRFALVIVLRNLFRQLRFEFFGLRRLSSVFYTLLLLCLLFCWRLIPLFGFLFSFFFFLVMFLKKMAHCAVLQSRSHDVTQPCT